MTDHVSTVTTARSDAADRLVSADEPLARLQQRCGGEIPGTIAIPALLDLVRKARGFGIKLARRITASDGNEAVAAWVEVEPEDEGCAIIVRNWQVTPLPAEDLGEMVAGRATIDRALAELSARLNREQRLLTVECTAADLAVTAEAMRSGLGQHWTEFVEIVGSQHEQPLHWRLLDGAEARVRGSNRRWRVGLLPQIVPGGEPAGFELLLTADTPLPTAVSLPQRPTGEPGLVGRDVAPVLREPIARIIANAETIRARLAGPLAEEYRSYAADIAEAGQHLLALVEDLADLEVVESDDFDTAPDRIDLAEVAQRATSLLSGRARERGIAIDAPRQGESLPAIAEARRALQILLNLIGNAIRYSPADSQIWVRLEGAGARARVIVADQGAGVSLEQQALMFEKFERLGRKDEGGSGLGLYISRRLARAMGGDLTVESAPGQGARFILDLPGDLLARSGSAPGQPQN